MGSQPPPPVAPPAPPEPGPQGVPWERRQELGAVAALFETIRESLFEPVSFFRRMAPSGGVGSPLFYGVLLGYAAQVVTSFYQMILQGVVGSALQRSSDVPDVVRQVASQLEGVGGFVTTLLFGWIFVVIGLFVWAALVHVALLMLGGAQRDFEASFRAVSYSQAGQLFAVIPLCGGLIGFVYVLVLNVIGLSELHGIGRGKATAAVLLPLFFCCCCGVLGILLIAGAIGGLVGALQ